MIRPISLDLDDACWGADPFQAIERQLKNFF